MPEKLTRRAVLQHAARWTLGAGLMALNPFRLMPGRAEASAPGHAPLRSSAAPVVYGWFPSRFNNWRTGSLDWKSLTHICFRSVEINADGSLKTPAGNPPRAFVETAHRHGVKVTVLAWVTSPQNSDGYLANAPEAAARNLLEYVRENDLDGVNIDDEQMQAVNSVAGKPNRDLVTRFFRILRTTFEEANPAAYHLTFAAPPIISEADRFAVTWLDLAGIAQHVDGIIPMGYTLNPPSIGWTTNPEPLGGGGKAATTTTRDIRTMAHDYLEAMGGHREKLLMGVSVSFGGYEWPCRNDQRLAPILARGTWQSLTACEAKAAAHGRRWDEAHASPWYAYEEGDAYVQGARTIRPSAGRRCNTTCGRRRD